MSQAIAAELGLPEIPALPQATVAEPALVSALEVPEFRPVFETWHPPEPAALQSPLGAFGWETALAQALGTVPLVFMPPVEELSGLLLGREPIDPFQEMVREAWAGAQALGAAEPPIESAIRQAWQEAFPDLATLGAEATGLPAGPGQLLETVVPGLPETYGSLWQPFEVPSTQLWPEATATPTGEPPMALWQPAVAAPDFSQFGWETPLAEFLTAQPAALEAGANLASFGWETPLAEFLSAQPAVDLGSALAGFGWETALTDLAVPRIPDIPSPLELGTALAGFGDVISGLSPGDIELATTAEFGPTGAEWSISPAALGSLAAGAVSPLLQQLGVDPLTASLAGAATQVAVQTLAGGVPLGTALTGSVGALVGPVLQALGADQTTVQVASTIASMVTAALMSNPYTFMLAPVMLAISDMFKPGPYERHRAEAAAWMPKLVPYQISRIMGAQTPAELEAALQPWDIHRVTWTGTGFGGGYELGEQLWQQTNPQVAQLLETKRQLLDLLALPEERWAEVGLTAETRAMLEEQNRQLRAQAEDLLRQTIPEAYGGGEAPVITWNPPPIYEGTPMGEGSWGQIGSRPIDYAYWTRVTPDPWLRAAQWLALAPHTAAYYTSLPTEATGWSPRTVPGYGLFLVDTVYPLGTWPFSGSPSAPLSPEEYAAAQAAREAWYGGYYSI
ncbi:MAG: hypothetical protein QN120_05305 [Armatimonadota bacterium]|nr:hypothetical protein [Armatimonadota bacterium]